MIRAALLASILIVGALLVGLTVVILVGKAWREVQAMRARLLRREIEPKVLHWAHGRAASVRAVLGAPTGRLARRVVEGVLLDHVERVRGVERDRLGAAFDELGYVDRYLEQLRSRRWWKRAEAAERLGLAGASRSREPLGVVLDDPVPEVRMRAAKALGAIGGRASAGRLIEALREPTRWSTIRIADVLTGMGREVILDLERAFPSMKRSGKLAILDICGRVRDLASGPWLRERLLDPESDVRARAAHALGALGDPTSGPALRAALADPKWPVRAMAAKALGRLRFRDAIPELGAALADREWWVRANAAEALRDLGEDGLAALDAALDARDAFARHQAVLMLQEAGELDRRVAALSGGDGSAGAWLRRVVATGRTERLRELAASHPDGSVRARLEALLREGAP